ncbi:MAG TPA: NAD(P)-dependent alcohol dehydrogenase [Candidatus Xenobia bacterium]|jgi:uncharacterized zinc-type alcohol dehydrogenase-like protein
MSEVAVKSGIATKGYAAMKPGGTLVPWEFARREPGPHDVLMDVAYCGICHSDVHQVKDEWSEGIFPMVPGHEVAGQVLRVGEKVTRFKSGDLVGVGCMVNSCRTCRGCREGLENYCENHLAVTYNGTEMDEVTPTYGGYSKLLVVDEAFALHLPANLDLARTAPLLCAGITTYSPLRHWKVGKGQRVGIVGLGGLGHMGVQFARAFGAEVFVFSTSDHKTADARRLGAHEVVNTRKEGALEALKGTFDFILSTVSSGYSLGSYIELLKRDATMVVVGLPPANQPPAVDLMALVSKRRTLAGSMIGGIAETQEMLDFCGQHNLQSDIELMPIDQVNTAYERLLKSDVRYRFVIDLKTLPT